MIFRDYLDKDGSPFQVAMTRNKMWRIYHYHKGISKSRPTPEQAQADLDAYAQKHGLREA